MELKKTGVLLKYLPFIGLLFLRVISIHQNMSIITDAIERSINIWTNILYIGAVIGAISSLLVMDKSNKILTGKKLNIVDDIYESNNQDFAVKYNGVFASSFFIIIICSLHMLYVHTQKRLFFNLMSIIAIACIISSLIQILAIYIETKTSQSHSNCYELSNLMFLPSIIFIIQILIIRKESVGTVWKNINNPQNELILVLTLIAVLCYVLFAAYSYFSNIYCLIGLNFIKKDILKVKMKMEFLHEKEQKRKENLRHTVKYIDESAEQASILKKGGLIFRYYFIQIKSYIQGRLYAVIYLLIFTETEITKRLKKLLEPKQIKINSIRFCCSMAVLELLSLNLFLFLHLESNSACLKFFELLSTVIIIPVLLSWLSGIKAKKR